MARHAAVSGGYAGSSWKSMLETKSMLMVGSTNNIMNGSRALWGKPGSPELYSSVHELPVEIRTQPGFQYYLLTKRDMERVDAEVNRAGCRTKNEKEAKKGEILKNFANFTKKYNAGLYLRTLPPENMFKDEDRRVFTEDVLRMLPIALERQGKLNEDLKAEILTLQLNWATTAPHLYRTIPMSELEQILKKFDVNKSQITLLDDILYYRTYQDRASSGGFIKTNSPNAEEVADRHQAIYKVFHDLVLGINWECRGCEELEIKIKALMGDILKMEKGSMITYDFINTSIAAIKTDYPAYYNPTAKQLDYLFKVPLVGNVFYTPEMTQFDPRRHIGMVTYFDLTDYMIFWEPTSSETVMHVYEHRFYIQLGWIQQFFEKNEENLEIIQLLADNLVNMVTNPELRNKLQRFLNDQITGTAGPNPKFRPWGSRKTGGAPKPETQAPASPPVLVVKGVKPTEDPIVVVEENSDGVEESPRSSVVVVEDPNDSFEQRLRAAYRRKREREAAARQ